MRFLPISGQVVWKQHPKGYTRGAGMWLKYVAQECGVKYLFSHVMLPNDFWHHPILQSVNLGDTDGLIFGATIIA